MPALDANRNASRRAVRRVNHQRARVVRQNRQQLVQRLSAPPPVSGADQARTGARAGVRPRPARPTPPRRTRPSFVGPTPEQAVGKAVRDVLRRGGNLRTKEQAAGRLRDVGLLPGMGPQEQRLAALRARQRAQQPKHSGGFFGEAVSGIPVVGGALKFGYQHIPALTRGIEAGLTLGASEIPVVGAPARELGRFLGRAGQETLDIAAETPPSLYHLGDLAVHGHVGAVAKALAQPYIQTAEHPLRSLTKQPVHTALLIGAPRLGAAARDLVGAARAGEVSAADVAELAGENRRFRGTVGVSGTALREDRPAARLTAPAQRREMAGKAKRADALRSQARQASASGDEAQAEALMKRANRVDPREMAPHKVAGRMTARNSVNEGVRRRNMADTMRTFTQIISKKGMHPLTRMIATGEVLPTVEDIAAYGRQLHDVLRGEGRRSLTPAERKATQGTVRVLEQSLKDIHSGKLDLGNLHDIATRYQAASVELQREAQRAHLLTPESEIARLLPYGNRQLGVRWDPPHYVDREGNRLSRQAGSQRALRDPESVKEIDGAYVDAQGRRMSTEQAITTIRSHMEQTMGRGYEPAWITQARGKGGRSNFYKTDAQRQTIRGKRRTGAATELGTFEATPESLIEAPALVRSFIEHDRGWKAMVNEFGWRHPDKPGEVYTRQDYAQIQKDAENLKTTTGREWVPVRVHPFMAHRGPLKSLIDSTHLGEAAAGDLPKDLATAMRDAVENPGKGPGPWALIPKEAAERRLAHLQRTGAGPSARVGQAAGQAFRKAVLAFSTKWATGNVVEAIVRNAVMGAGPLDFVRMNRALKQLEEHDQKYGTSLAKEAREFIGTGHLGSVERLNIYRPPKHWANEESGPALKTLAKTLDGIGKLPPAKLLSNSWRLYTHVVFGGMGWLEGRARIAMGGHLLARDGMRSIEEAVQGLKDTNTQARFAREIDRAYGQYDKFNPDLKGLLQRYTPFLPWFLNAVKFLTVVLPRDHPVLTSLLASANQATADWRKAHGLKIGEKGALPAFMQGSIPSGKGHIIFKYTPFAAAADPAGNIAGAVLPQVSSFVNALQGKNWNGNDLPKGTNKVWFALNTLMGSFVPGAGPALRISGAMPTSKTAKQMSVGRRAIKEFNPFYVTPENTRGTSTSTKAHPAWGGNQNTTGAGWGDKPSSSSRKPAAAGWGG